MKLSLLLLVGTVTAFQNKNGIRIRSSLLFSTKSARSNFFADDFTLLQLEKLQEAAKPRRYNDLDEISQLITSGIKSC